MLHGGVRVRNLLGRPITVMLMPADIRNSSNGNADYATTALSQAGRWLTLAARSVRLQPHAVSEVAFSVTVPAAAHGASHYAGIVAIDSADLASAAAGKKTRGRTFSFQRINRQALPLTIRLPGPLSRGLALRAISLSVQPAGAGLVLRLHPDGSELTEGAQVQVRVLRGARTVLRSDSTLGQLFPGADLGYRIPWVGQVPVPGTYRVLGVIRPRGAPAIRIDQTVAYTAAKADQLKRETPPTAGPRTAFQAPPWMWALLAGGAFLLSCLLVAVWRLARRPSAGTIT